MKSPLSADESLQKYNRFWQLWRERAWFECHEVLEDLWRETPGCERWFLNGLIHLAVARYQHERGNANGAARQWTRARTKLEPFRPRYDYCGDGHVVDVNDLLEEAEREIAVSLLQLNGSQRAALELVEHHARSRIQADFA